MKIKSLILIGIVALGLAMETQAQTNTSIPQDLLNLGGDVLDGPWAVAAGYGHSITGTGNNVAFEVVSYDLVTNVNNSGFSSGVIAGLDQMWSAHAHQMNSLSGGWQFSETGKPLAFTGISALTNMTVTVDLYQLVATPRGGSDVGAITGTSLSLDVMAWKSFHLKPIALYENRNGQAGFDGNYLLGGLAITHAF
jgi:hypothetical protein